MSADVPGSGAKAEGVGDQVGAGKKLSRRGFLKLLALGGAGALAAAYPVFGERYLIGVNHYRIPVRRLPQAFAGFTIAQITDVHYGYLTPLPVLEFVVWRTNRLGTDITVLTGDYIHELDATGQIDAAWPVLSQLRARQGVFAVLGNHDHWADTGRSRYWLERSGFDLRHKATFFERDGKRLWLGGTGDLWEDRQTIDAIFAQAPQQECKIVLAHNPDSADEPFETRIDLMISGHTHGGQVRLPFIGAPVLPVRNKRYSSGVIQAESCMLFISRGIGWTVYPVRINCPPEIAVLELTPA